MLLLLVGVSALSRPPTAVSSPPRSRCRVRMGWGGDVVWSDVEILSNDEAAAGLRAMSIAIPEAAKLEFKVPGQFVQLKEGDAKPGFFAIASPPNATSFEFLIKDNDVNAWLARAKQGATLSMSGVMGKGFDIKGQLDGDTGDIPRNYDGFQCMNHLYFATGSGIAPMRSVVEHGSAIGLPKPALLYYGCRDSQHNPYKHKFDAWLADYNVEVVEIHSNDADWKGHTGYVQDTLRELGVPVPRNTGACICGQKDMFLAVKDILLDAGVYEGRILTNF